MAITASDYVRQSAWDPAYKAALGNTSILDSFASAFYDIFPKQIPGGRPTADQVTDFFVQAATPAIRAGQIDYTSVQGIAKDYAAKKYPTAADTAATDSAGNAVKATSSFLSGFAPFSSLAGLNLSPADAAAVISLEQTTQSNQLGLTAQARAVNGAVTGDTNNSSLPGGGTPANPVAVARGSSAYVLVGAALLLFFLFRKK